LPGSSYFHLKTYEIIEYTAILCDFTIQRANAWEATPKPDGVFVSTPDN